MTSNEIHRSHHPDGFLRARAPGSDETTGADTFAQRATSSSSPVATSQQVLSGRIPPPAPSPPPHHSPSPIPQTFSTALTPAGMGNETPGNLSQWLFTDDEILNSPSVLDGLSPLEERSRRAKGVNFIIQAGILLKIPQLTLGTASVFFHRFYMRLSMVPEKGGLHHYNIAATALFLATKAEENCRKTKEIVIAVAKVAQKNSSLIIDEQSKEFWRWKDSILLHEEMMLELLTFDVVLESPYTSLSNFIRELDIENNKNLRNAAWAFLNDSCMTTLCLQMPPKDIAVASLYFSAKFNHDRIPDDHDGAPWWLSIGGDPNRITKAIAVMREHYTEDPLKKSNNPYDQSPTWSVEDLERTRLRAESRSPISRRQAEDLAMNDEGEIDDKKNGHLEEADVKHEIAEGSQLTAVAGDDDTKLKLAANDPATHEAVNGETNGALASPLPSVKRKDAPLADTEATEISVAKRPKVERETEESEEGEVEE